MNLNTKLLIRAENKLKTYSTKQIYNFKRFGSPINLKLSEGLLKQRARAYSRTYISNKLQFCRKCFSFKNIQRHHTDYKKPEKITFLCRKCHWKEYK